MMEKWFPNSSEKAKRFFQVCRSSTSVVTESREGWVGGEAAVSQPHSSSDSRDKAVCSGTEKTLITTEVNDSIHFPSSLFYRFLHSVQSHISVLMITTIFPHSRAIIKLGPLAS